MDVFTVGETVRFTKDQMIDSGTIVLTDMLGVVKPGHYVCTPGISVMIRPIGANWEFGFLYDGLERVESEPTKEEIEKSIYLNENSFEIYHERNGRTGLLKIKGTIRTEEQAHIEIGNLCMRLREENSSGHVKRLGRVLRVFKHHQDIDLLNQLADELMDDRNRLEVLDKIMVWNEQGEVGESVPVNYGNEVRKRTNRNG